MKPFLINNKMSAFENVVSIVKSMSCFMCFFHWQFLVVKRLTHTLKMSSSKSSLKATTSGQGLYRTPLMSSLSSLAYRSPS